MSTPRKSDKLHVLMGTKPHDRTPEITSTLTAGRPKFPKSLSGDAKRVFKQLCRQLAERRALTEGDGHLLSLYATIWDRRARAQERLLVEGEIRVYSRLDSNGVERQSEKPNLWLKVANDAERQLVSILDRLGLTPLAGSKIKQTAQSPERDQPKPGTAAYIVLQYEKEQLANVDTSGLPA
jgi:P27 family predicted phage terminase small subunit